MFLICEPYNIYITDFAEVQTLALLSR